MKIQILYLPLCDQYVKHKRKTTDFSKYFRQFLVPTDSRCLRLLYFYGSFETRLEKGIKKAVVEVVATQETPPPFVEAANYGRLHMRFVRLL